MTTPALLPVRAAAHYLSVGKDTVYKLIRTGQLPTVDIGAGPRPLTRVRVADLDTLISNRTQPKARP